MIGAVANSLPFMAYLVRGQRQQVDSVKLQAPVLPFEGLRTGTFWKSCHNIILSLTCWWVDTVSDDAQSISIKGISLVSLSVLSKRLFWELLCTFPAVLKPGGLIFPLPSLKLSHLLFLFWGSLLASCLPASIRLFFIVPHSSTGSAFLLLSVGQNQRNGSAEIAFSEWDLWEWKEHPTCTKDYSAWAECSLYP